MIFTIHLLNTLHLQHAIGCIRREKPINITAMVLDSIQKLAKVVLFVVGVGGI